MTLRRLTDAERVQIRSDYRQLRRQRLSSHGTVRRIVEARQVLPEVVTNICGDLIDADQHIISGAPIPGDPYESC